ncbi:DUF4296 domain-containing protein [Psychroserpens sp.]|uniref:DUF4296 domain-containing protein n=1 Tax=Psychroserpens sp. TaxID=2020870 RepID=UPI002B27567A|nr:DUF4296 domain-containing protein [Psychroserpens sp.]
MIKRISLLILVLGLCFACHRIERPKKPDNLIPKDKMADVLFDVFVFNAAKGSDHGLLQSNNVTPTIYIFEKHQIDSLQFVKSNEYYAYDVKAYEDLINKVELKIKAKKAFFEKEKELEEERRKKRLDSIKKIGDSIKPGKNLKSYRKN